MPPLPHPRDASLGDWNTESCQTLETQAAHTRCQCQHLSTFAVLAQPPKDLVSGREAPGLLKASGWPQTRPRTDVPVGPYMERGLLFIVMTAAQEYVATVGECEHVCTRVHLVVSGRVRVNGCKYICARVPFCT